jgi:phage shock protein A
MSEQLLSTIIALEKELQRQVQEELSRAAAWRERQLAALAKEEERVRTTLATERAAQIEADRRSAVAEGERAVATVRLWCARLEALPEDVCVAQLVPLLRRLLPEAGDDHAHGQS